MFGIVTYWTRYILYKNYIEWIGREKFSSSKKGYPNITRYSIFVGARNTLVQFSAVRLEQRHERSVLRLLLADSRIPTYPPRSRQSTASTLGMPVKVTICVDSQTPEWATSTPSAYRSMTLSQVAFTLTRL